MDQLIKLCSEVREQAQVDYLPLSLYIYIYHVSHCTTARVLRSQFGLPSTTIWRIFDEISTILSKMENKSLNFQRKISWKTLRSKLVEKAQYMVPFLRYIAVTYKLIDPKKSFCHITTRSNNLDLFGCSSRFLKKWIRGLLIKADRGMCPDL